MEENFEVYRLNEKTGEARIVLRFPTREVALNFVNRSNTEVKENRFKYYAIKEGTQLPKQLKIPFIYDK